MLELNEFSEFFFFQIIIQVNAGIVFIKSGTKVLCSLVQEHVFSSFVLRSSACTFGLDVLCPTVKELIALQMRLY